jgi:hypothetical protein
LECYLNELKLQQLALKHQQTSREEEKYKVAGKRIQVGKQHAKKQIKKCSQQ